MLPQALEFDRAHAATFEWSPIRMLALSKNVSWLLFSKFFFNRWILQFWPTDNFHLDSQPIAHFVYIAKINRKINVRIVRVSFARERNWMHTNNRHANYHRLIKRNLVRVWWRMRWWWPISIVKMLVHHLKWKIKSTNPLLCRPVHMLNEWTGPSNRCAKEH